MDLGLWEIPAFHRLAAVGGEQGWGQWREILPRGVNDLLGKQLEASLLLFFGLKFVERWLDRTTIREWLGDVDVVSLYERF